MPVKKEAPLVGGVPYMVLAGVYIVACLNLLYKACIAAYEIRMYAINEYGRVIHEFDPVGLKLAQCDNQFDTTSLLTHSYPQTQLVFQLPGCRIPLGEWIQKVLSVV